MIFYKFSSLLSDTIEEGDKENMEVAETMFKKAVQTLIDLDQDKAQDFLECFEGTLKYYNYLTEQEAASIVSHFINQDGSKGARWSPEEFFQAVQAFGGDHEYEPYYNKWALYVTANKFASDQGSVVRKWTGDDKLRYAEACYDLSVTQLEDKDKPNWARWYFDMND